MKHFFVFLRNGATGICLLAFLIAACNKKNPFGADDSPANVVVRITVADSARTTLTNQSLEKIARIAKVVITVTGPGIDPPIVKELQISGKTATGSLKVKQGNSRTFTVVGKDENGVTQLEGANTVDIKGASATVDIPVAKVFPNPSPLRVEGVLQHNLVRLAWDKNNDVDFKLYELYRSTTPSRPSQPLVVISDRNATSYADTTVEGQRAYTYWLNTVDSEGYNVAENTSVTLPQANANTPPNPTPASVTMTKQSESRSKVTLSWTRSEASSFASYRLVRAEAPAVSFQTEPHFDITDRNTTSFTDSNFAQCKAYYYAVYAVGRASYGDFPSKASNTVTSDASSRKADYILGVYSEFAPEVLIFSPAPNANAFIGNYSGAGGRIIEFPDDPTTKCEGGISKKTTLSVNVSLNQFAGWFVQWGKAGSPDSETRDMSKYLGGKLSFCIKSSVNDLEIGIRSGNIQPPGTENSKVYLSSHPSFKPDNEWHKVSIPLADFIQREPRTDLSKMKILFNVASNVPSGGTGGVPQTFWIDDVRWEKLCEGQ